MNKLSTKSSLSDSEQWLVELMQTLNFGRIEALHVRAGAPVANPAPQVIQKLKIGGENGPRPERAHDDFLLKRQTIEMLEALRELGDGKVLAIEVKHGLPFSLEIELPGAKAGSSAGGRRG
jgi:hypothetical protein